MVLRSQKDDVWLRGHARFLTCIDSRLAANVLSASPRPLINNTRGCITTVRRGEEPEWRRRAEACREHTCTEANRNAKTLNLFSHLRWNCPQMEKHLLRHVILPRVLRCSFTKVIRSDGYRLSAIPPLICHLYCPDFWKTPSNI